MEYVPARADLCTSVQHGAGPGETLSSGQRDGMTSDFVGPFRRLLAKDTEVCTLG